MAMKYVQTNIAAELISIQARLAAMASMYGNEAMGTLTDADFASVPDLAHITAAEFQTAGGALVAVSTAIGTDANSNWAKLLKIVNSVPR
jgi:hypothetical protein